MLTAKLQAIGNVGKIETSYTPQGQLVTKGSVAVNRGKSGKKETDWYDFVAWGNSAEWMRDSVQKGTRIYIEGRLEQQKWEDKNEVQHTKLVVTVADFNVLDNGKERPAADQEDDNPFPAE